MRHSRSALILLYFLILFLSSPLLFVNFLSISLLLRIFSILLLFSDFSTFQVLLCFPIAVSVLSAPHLFAFVMHKHALAATCGDTSRKAGAQPSNGRDTAHRTRRRCESLTRTDSCNAKRAAQIPPVLGSRLACVLL